MKRSFSWSVLHTLAIIFVAVGFLTGLRIAMLTEPGILWLSPLLPQGELFSVHVLSALAFTSTVIGYLIYRLLVKKNKNDKSFRQKGTAERYYYIIKWYGYFLVLFLIITGWLQYYDLLENVPVVQIHYYSALGVLLYLILHGGAYFIHLGSRILERIFSPLLQFSVRNILVLVVASLIFQLLWLVFGHQHTIPLAIKHVSIDDIISIDGVDNEDVWRQARGVNIMTHGGENFVSGETRINIKAVENGIEAYFLISWDDPTKSLKHLPLIKTETGWKVRQHGFHHFDETEFYEDKLAVLLAENCELGGGGTAHLGPKPLSGKPPNWQGKGYHYAETGGVRDLWHWKAVRTNAMYLADDNFIGKPDIVRPGLRRYTAGYMQDGKESGAYVMNWKWYKQETIVPKRLPKDPGVLAQYQTDSEDLNWVIPWFEYEPYSGDKDTYPVGTIMPSVMYRSNRFEGDRADVTAHAVWKEGRWSLELARKLDTHSKYDVPIRDGICLWVSAFDHSQTAHTRHTQAIQLWFEKVDD